MIQKQRRPALAARTFGKFVLAASKNEALHTTIASPFQDDREFALDHSRRRFRIRRARRGDVRSGFWPRKNPPDRCLSIVDLRTGNVALIINDPVHGPHPRWMLPDEDSAAIVTLRGIASYWRDDLSSPDIAALGEMVEKCVLPDYMQGGAA